MNVNDKKISGVVKILKQAVKDFKDPSVTMVGKKYRDPFLVLISCILSLRTKDETTIPAAERLFKLAKSPSKMFSLDAKKIEQAIYPVGFYRVKAKNILGICKDILEKFGGKVPENIDELLTMKGIGRKTANLVLTEGFGKLGVCVDTHVHRISNRLGYVVSRNPNETELMLRKSLPKRYWIEYNSLLVVWGQNVCRPVSPFCSKCPVSRFCSRIGVNNAR
ncbi:MAG: endonuclease III [Candidatus Omnitrophica bacterium]|nr:endonuclease III [Candidatus Omnitrophota bacterium]